MEEFSSESWLISQVPSGQVVPPGSFFGYLLDPLNEKVCKASNVAHFSQQCCVLLGFPSSDCMLTAGARSVTQKRKCKSRVYNLRKKLLILKWQVRPQINPK